MTPTERLRAAQQRPAGIAHDYATSVVRTDDLAALLAERDALAAVAEAARALFEVCGCPPDWLMQDGSHDRDCIQSEPTVKALRAAYDRAVSRP